MAERSYAVYFVPTPLGNMGDMTLRSLEVLKTVDVVCCEDTRNTGRLLDALGIKKPLLSLHEYNEAARAEEVATRALAGETFAMVSDAGMPGISDPGYRLVQVLKAREVEFTVLPGPSAVLTALVGSGLPSDAFYFGGFLPVKSGKKAQVLQNALVQSYTSIFYESPFRIEKTVTVLAEMDAEAPICVAKELTKLHETYWRGKAADVLVALKAGVVKGEFVLLIGGQNARSRSEMPDERPVEG